MSGHPAIVLRVSCCLIRISLLSRNSDPCLSADRGAPQRSAEHCSKQAAQLEEENQGLRNMLKELDDGELYLVVDTESNRLTMRQGKACADGESGDRQPAVRERGNGEELVFRNPDGIAHGPRQGTEPRLDQA